MSTPRIRILVDGFTLTDFTSRIVGVSYNYGRSSELDYFNVGSAQIELKNNDGVLTPDGDGLYKDVTWLGDEIIIDSVVGGVYTVLFRGFIDGVDITATKFVSSLILTCVDSLSLLGSASFPAHVFASELSGTRIKNVLMAANTDGQFDTLIDSAGVTTGLINIDVGDALLEASGTVSGAVMPYLQQVVDSEAGNAKLFCKMGQIIGTPRLVVSAIAVGGDIGNHAHSVYVSGSASYGPLFATGNNGSGQLGNGGTVNSSTFVQVGTATDWSNPSAGFSYTFASRGTAVANQLYSWGLNSSGQLGLGDTTPRSSPTAVAGTAGTAHGAWTVCGHNYTIVSDTDGHLFATGDNLYGQLGLGDTTQRSSFVQIGTAVWDEVAVGWKSSYAIRGNQLYSWGFNDYGQLGLGDTTPRSSPTAVAGTAWDKVAAGRLSVLALNTSGHLYSWGENDKGQLGKDVPDQDTPMLVDDTRVYTAIWCKHYAGFALDSTGTIWQTGISINAPDESPPNYTLRSITSAAGGSVVGATSKSDATFMAVAGGLFAVGWNNTGQLGLGDTTPRSEWTQVIQPIIGNYGIIYSQSRSAAPDRPSPAITFVETAGTAAGSILFQSLTLSYTKDLIINQAIFDNSTTQATSTNYDSIARNKIRTVTKTVLNNTLSLMQVAADSLVGRYKTPKLRADNLSVAVHALTAEQAANVLKLSVNDRVTVVYTPAGAGTAITQGYVIESVAGQLGDGGLVHTIVYGIAQASQGFIIGDSTFGRLDSNLSRLGV